MDHFDPSKGRVTLESTNSLSNEDQVYDVHGFPCPSRVLTGNENDGPSPVSQSSDPSNQTLQPKKNKRGIPTRSILRNSGQINIADSGTGPSEQIPEELSKAYTSETNQAIVCEGVQQRGAKDEHKSPHSVWIAIYGSSINQGSGPGEPSSNSSQLRSLHASAPTEKNGESPGSNSAEWSFLDGEQNTFNALPVLEHLSEHGQEFTTAQPSFITSEPKASRINQFDDVWATNAFCSSWEIESMDALDPLAWSVPQMDCSSNGPLEQSGGGKSNLITDRQECKTHVVSPYERGFSNFTSGFNAVSTGLSAAIPSSSKIVQFECTEQKDNKGYRLASEYRKAGLISNTSKQMSQNALQPENQDTSHRARSFDAQDTSNDITHVLRSTRPLENENRNQNCSYEILETGFGTDEARPQQDKEGVDINCNPCNCNSDALSQSFIGWEHRLSSPGIQQRNESGGNANGQNNYSKDDDQLSIAGKKQVSHTVLHYENPTNQSYLFDADEPSSTKVKIPQYSESHSNIHQNSMNSGSEGDRSYGYRFSNEDTSLWDREQPEMANFVQFHQFDGAGSSSITGRSQQRRGGVQFNAHGTNTDIRSAGSDNDHVPGFGSTDLSSSAGKRPSAQTIPFNSSSSSQYYGFDAGSPSLVRGIEQHSNALHFDENHKNAFVEARDNKHRLDKRSSDIDLSLSDGKRPLVLNSSFGSSSIHRYHRSNEAGPSSATDKQPQRTQTQLKSYCTSQRKKSKRVRFRLSEGSEEQTEKLDVYNEGRRHHSKRPHVRPKSCLRQDIHATHSSVSKETDQHPSTSDHMENGKKVLRDSLTSSSMVSERPSWSEIRADFLRTAVKRPDFATVPDFVQELYRGKDHILEQLMHIIGVDQCIERFALANNLLTPDELEYLTNISSTYNSQPNQAAESSCEIASYLIGNRVHPENRTRLNDHVYAGPSRAQFRTSQEVQVNYDQGEQHENGGPGHTQGTTRPFVSAVTPFETDSVSKEEFSSGSEDCVGRLPNIRIDNDFSPIDIDDLLLNIPIPELDEKETTKFKK